MNIKINQSIIASTPLAKKLYTVLMEILFFYAPWQTKQNFLFPETFDYLDLYQWVAKVSINNSFYGIFHQNQ